MKKNAHLLELIFHIVFPQFKNSYFVIVMSYAILLSGGVGQRLGNSTPKQYIECNGKPIIAFSLATLINNGYIDEVVIVAASQWIPFIQNLIDQLETKKEIYFANPGDTRQLSILSGLEEIKHKHHRESNDDIVIIHDAARPLVSDALLCECFTIDDVYDGVMPVLPVKDTIYFSEDGNVISNLLDRSKLFAGQAPESFRFGRYYQAHKALTYEELLTVNGSSELAYKAGLRIKLVKGDPMNFKITDSQDLENFKRLTE